MKHLKLYNSFINEGRFYNEELNPIFWSDGVFNPEVRTKLLQIAHDFYADLKVTAPIEDIQLTGSLANYNWTEHSDLDVHVIMDLSTINPDLELVKTAMEGLKTTWNQRHPVNIHGFDVELYAQDINQLHLASGLYSLMKNEWLREPEFNPPTIDPKDVDVKADSYVFAIKQMMNDLKDSSPEEARDIMERASVLKKKISKSRDEQLAHKGGEFSVENLVFKKLRNEGWIGKLIDIKAQAYSRIYSEPTGAVDSEFSTEADVLDESLVGKGSTVLVLGPKVEGSKRLFLFHADWSRQVERNGWTVNMVGLTAPACIIQEQDGRLVAKTISISPGNLKKYAGLTDYNVVLNSKTKTPFWHQTVKYTNAASLLKDLSADIRSIPEVTFN
ncbi:hypothetical protein UFOVP1604_138 [uncultured Caudovirales phage]|uniref:Uncharacterized protein n=1 Tax=uncultured Caudovirales phage TaxID=2100421 RepID=A0A6J5SUP8_9CAUD|nr:hypothetical protein UFOVP1604_138 [uncultured Caudovirales phage]